jgi:hypothetical protein
MNREKSNPNPSYTFPEPLDFITVKKSRESHGRLRPGPWLRGRSDARHGALDSFQCGRDIFPGRPGFHSSAGGRAEA